MDVLALLLGCGGVMYIIMYALKNRDLRDDEEIKGFLSTKKRSVPDEDET